ncbi:hypothetical protein PV325_008835, partial [Microctonus aethiopoides]
MNLHEASALGCEVMCSYWQQGNCLNEHCNFRHMELKKDRKSIACYWENQRGGCKKPHCPFLHSLERAASNETTINNPNKPTSELPSSKPVNQEWSNRQDDGKFDGSGTESDQGRGSSEAGSFIGSPAVDPLIVNFDEDIDIPSRINIGTSVASGGLNVSQTSVQAMQQQHHHHHQQQHQRQQQQQQQPQHQTMTVGGGGGGGAAAACHHASPYAPHQGPFHSHSHSQQLTQPLQSQATTPTQIHRSTFNPNAHPEQSTSSQRS